MKKVLLLLAALIGLSVGMSAKTVTETIKSADVTFTSGSGYKDFKHTSTNGAEYAGNAVNQTTKWQFNKNTTGFWITKSIGKITSVTLTFDQASTKGVLLYGSEKEYNAAPTTTQIGSAITSTTTIDLSDKSYNAIGIKGNGGVAYLTSITIVYEVGNTGGDETAVPELPDVTFDGTTAVNGESYEVAAGTTVNVSSKNATTVYVNGTAMNSFVVNEAGSYTIYGENANGKSAEFTVSFTIKQSTPVVPGTGTTFVRVNSAADLVAGGKYTIVYGNRVATKTTSDYIPTIETTITNNSFEATTDVLTFTLENGTVAGTWALALDNYAGTGKYLGGSSSTKFTHPTSAANCNITFDGNNVKISFTASNTRFARWYSSNSEFRNYTSSNGDGYPQLYKQVVTDTEPVDFEPEIGAVPALYPEDKHQIVIANEAKPATFTFESKNPEIATVSETGEITAVAEGTATITISWEGDKTWNAGSKDITVEVKKALADPELWFRHTEVHGKINVGVVAQAVHHKSPGKITYSSSNPAVAVVDPNTGMIIPANVKSVGHTTITANIEATEEYRSGSLSYELYIEEPDFGSTAPAGEKMFDFTAANPEGYGMFDFTTTYFSNDHTYYERNINEKEGEQYASHVPVMTIKDVDPVTLSFDGDVRRWNGKELRVYFKAKMTFSVPAGYSIEKITLNTNGANKFKAETGTYSSGTWTADSEGCTSVTFTQDDISQAAVYTITVVLKKAESDRTLADLNFETRTYNTYAGELTTVNAVKTPNLEDLRDLIVYSIDNLETGFVIDVVDDNTLNVTVDEPGVYTLRARTSATDKYLRGVAILRLNVFPKVELEHNAEEVTNGLMIVPAEGGKVKFGELPSTVALMVKRNGDAEFKAHDGSELTFADDDNLEYYMEYAETYRHGESKLEVVVRPTVPTHDEATGTHTFAPSKGAMLYHTALTVENMAKMMAPAADGTEWTKLATDDVLNVNPADYNLTDGQRLAFKAKSVKVASDGTEVAGPEKRFAILSNGQLSGVEDVEIEAEGAVRFYNLNGVEVDAADMAPGMYIRRSGSKAEKVVIK